MIEGFQVPFSVVNTLHSVNGTHHDGTCFLASNLLGKISIDPSKTNTSTSDTNYVTSSDIYDDRYLCDTPLVSAVDKCGGAAGSRGLVGETGRNFQGSSVDPSGSSLSTLGVAGPVNGIPHPSFRFAQKVTDVKFNMLDVTNPGVPKTVWNARFSLRGPDNSLGSDYLPSSLAPTPAQDNFAFHKLCSAVNSSRTYQLKIEAGGNAPINQTIVMNSRIVKPFSEIDSSVSASGSADSATASLGKDGSRLQLLGPRLYSQNGGPTSDSVAAIPSARSSFAVRHVMTALDQDDGRMLISGEPNRFTAVTATSFCGRLPKGCHRPPIVTIHTPKSLQTQQASGTYPPGYALPQQPGMNPGAYPPGMAPPLASTPGFGSAPVSRGFF
jgi:hypothetical protein